MRCHPDVAILLQQTNGLFVQWYLGPFNYYYYFLCLHAGCSHIVALLQIRKPDEYDCMFTCQIRSQCVYHPSSPSKGYAGLRIFTSANWEPSELLSPSDDKPFVCPKAFKAHVRQHVETILLCKQPRGKQIGMSKNSNIDCLYSLGLLISVIARLMISVGCNIFIFIGYCHWPTKLSQPPYLHISNFLAALALYLLLSLLGHQRYPL